jgi:hypothetical protein
MSCSLSFMAGFEVTTYGRFWVTAEAICRQYQKRPVLRSVGEHERLRGFMSPLFSSGDVS